MFEDFASRNRSGSAATRWRRRFVHGVMVATSGHARVKSALPRPLHAIMAALPRAHRKNARGGVRRADRLFFDYLVV